MPRPGSDTPSPSSPPVLVWFRQDLRLADNPALNAGLASGVPLALVYVLEEGDANPWGLGSASRWWLHGSLAALSADIAARGGRLILRRGPAEAVIPARAEEIGAVGVHWNRRYEPAGMAIDAKIKAALKAKGVAAESHKGTLLFEPFELKTGSGGPFKVYTPFSKAARAKGVDGTLSEAPARLPASPQAASDKLEDWGLLPTKPDWAGGLRQAWIPGEAEAQKRLAAFASHEIKGYGANRNRMDLDATSRLSPRLHWGEISPLRVWRAAEEALAAHPDWADDIKILTNELLWREFSHHLLFTFPALPEQNWKDAFAAFPWVGSDAPEAEAWRRGRTGYPIVDAAMRQLWSEGYVHNRARMIAASFLIKHLLVDWRVGEAWYWDTLVDADLANNAASWQWVAGSGADAAPFFRIFNPVTQGEDYDPDGAYVRRWVPELGNLPNAFIHKPWTAPYEVLNRAGVRLGQTYPQPIVDHAQARARALAAYETVKLQRPDGTGSS